MMEENTELKHRDNIFRRAIKKLYEQPLDISPALLGYLTLIFVGMTYSFFYFMVFKINIFRFSDINDFLMAPFQELFVIPFCIFGVLIVVLLANLDDWLRKNHTELYKKLSFKKDIHSQKSERKRDSAFIFCFVLYIFVGAEVYGVYAGKKTIDNLNFLKYNVDVELKIPTDSLIFVGDNSGYYFFYLKTKKQAIVIPRDKVNYVLIEKRKGGSIF